MNNKKNFPILLLDEIVAHLDNKIRFGVFEELKTLKNQGRMSGADITLFSSIIKVWYREKGVPITSWIINSNPKNISPV